MDGLFTFVYLPYFVEGRLEAQLLKLYCFSLLIIFCLFEEYVLLCYCSPVCKLSYVEIFVSPIVVLFCAYPYICIHYRPCVVRVLIIAAYMRYCNGFVDNLPYLLKCTFGYSLVAFLHLPYFVKWKMDAQLINLYCFSLPIVCCHLEKYVWLCCCCTVCELGYVEISVSLIVILFCAYSCICMHCYPCDVRVLVITTYMRYCNGFADDLPYLFECSFGFVMLNMHHLHDLFLGYLEPRKYVFTLDVGLSNLSIHVLILIANLERMFTDKYVKCEILKRVTARPAHTDFNHLTKCSDIQFPFGSTFNATSIHVFMIILTSNG